MISIRNISVHPRATGPHLYALMVNKDMIATFLHRREEGLATCLYKAYRAALSEELRPVSPVDPTLSLSR